MARTPIVRTRRDLVREVVAPRLRPVPRLAIKGAIALVACVLAYGASRAMGAALATHDWKVIQTMVDRERVETQAAWDRERQEARRKALSNGYDPDEVQLCELLHHRSLAACDRAALERLDAEQAQRADLFATAPSIRGSDQRLAAPAAAGVRSPPAGGGRVTRLTQAP